MTTQYVPEIDVVIATALWLYSNSCVIQVISLPKGEGIDSIENRKKLKNKLLASNITLEAIRFKSEGPDIVASFNEGKDIWKIECKGLGKGREGTLRENFTRALASTVSYYDSRVGLRLGLAIPKHNTYLNLLGSKIPPALREELKLWIFLYNKDADSVEIFNPTSQIPSGEKRRGREIERIAE
jgi:hypothetical protein